MKPNHRVLEVGTGSGYQAAVLSRLAREVVTLERYRTLANSARARLKTLGYDNVEVLLGDGLGGEPLRAPYDRIIVTAAAESIPPALIAQLADGGIMVLPLGPARRRAGIGQADQDRAGLSARKPDPGALRAAVAGAGAGIVTAARHGVQFVGISASFD